MPRIQWGHRIGRPVGLDVRLTSASLFDGNLKLVGCKGVWHHARLPGSLTRFGTDIIELCRFKCRGCVATKFIHRNGRFRRVSPVPRLPGEGPFTERRADAQRGGANRNRVRSAG
jgi:hypothetical protein